MLSPIRAVLFWPEQKKPTSNPIIKYGMLTFVYEPLGLTIPQNTQKYIFDAYMTYYKVTTQSALSNVQYVKLMKMSKIPEEFNNFCASAPMLNQSKALSKFYGSVIEPLASSKSEHVSEHILNKTSLEAIRPSKIIPLSELKYSTKSLTLLHTLSHEKMHSDPIHTLINLSKFMERINRTVIHTNHSQLNLYVCIFLFSVAKACKLSLNVKLLLFTETVMSGAGICFGPHNKYLRHTVELLTVRMCPWCYKPVNFAYKKKLFVGGAHKSQVFTDEYTHDPVYCSEKNNLGIKEYPLIGVNPVSNSLFTNTLRWDINGSNTYLISVYQNSNTGCAEIKIIDKKSLKTVFVPLALTVHCTPKHIKNGSSCMLCVE